MNDPQELSVGIEEYSDLKIEVAQKLLLRDGLERPGHLIG